MGFASRSAIRCILSPRWKEVWTCLRRYQTGLVLGSCSVFSLLTCLLEEFRERKETLKQVINDNFSAIWNVDGEEICESVKTLSHFKTNIDVTFNETLNETEILEKQRPVHLNSLLFFLVKQFLWDFLEGSRQTLNDVLISVAKEEL